MATSRPTPPITMPVNSDRNIGSTVSPVVPGPNIPPTRKPNSGASTATAVPSIMPHMPGGVGSSTTGRPSPEALSSGALSYGALPRPGPAPVSGSSTPGSGAVLLIGSHPPDVGNAVARGVLLQSLGPDPAHPFDERADDVDGQREHHGGVLIRTQFEQGLQITQLQRRRTLAEGHRGVAEFGRRLQFAARTDHLRPSFPFRLGLPGHRALHHLGDLDVLDLHDLH